MKMSSAGQTMGVTCTSQPKFLAEGVSGLWMVPCHIYMDTIADFSGQIKKRTLVQYSFLTGPPCLTTISIQGLLFL